MLSSPPFVCDILELYTSICELIIFDLTLQLKDLPSPKGGVNTIVCLDDAVSI